MNVLRRLPTRRLLLLCAAVLAVAGGGTAIAVAAISSDAPAPPPKPLAQAIHDALAAPPVAGVTARIKFTNRLVDAASLDGEGGNPLLSGATGRLWLSRDGGLRLELQSRSGDAQVVVNQGRFFLYDASSNTAYRGTLPREGKAGRSRGRADGRARGRAHGVPTVARIERALSRAMRRLSLSGAQPGSVAGQPSYTVRFGPRHDGGLLGAGELAWDAVRGTPLRAAIYAQGNPSPVLELVATDIAYGAVPASALAVQPPAGAKVVQVRAPAGRRVEGRRGRRRGRVLTGARAVRAALPFRLTAPPTLVGLPRTSVRELDWHGTPAALVTYGRHLGGIAVIERRPAREEPLPGAAPKRRGHGEMRLPTVSIGGATGTELATALGTVVSFERRGVSCTVLGSVPPAAAEAAARGL